MPGHVRLLHGRRRATPRFDVIDTEFGTSYGAYRPAEDDTYYWRIAHFLFPFYTMIPTGVLGAQVRFRAWVPMDDEHTMYWRMSSQPADARRRRRSRSRSGIKARRRHVRLPARRPRTGYGRFRLDRATRATTT